MTCKNLGVDAFAYLRDVLERISTHPARRIGELLPDQWKKERVAAEAEAGGVTALVTSQSRGGRARLGPSGMGCPR